MLCGIGGIRLEWRRKEKRRLVDFFLQIRSGVVANVLKLIQYCLPSAGDFSKQFSFFIFLVTAFALLAISVRLGLDHSN